MNKGKELLLEIDYNCNLNCIHCSSINCEGHIKVKDIPTYLYDKKEERDYLDEIGVVRISGDEPTLIPNLIDYINFFYDRNIKVVLQTNGTIPNIWHKNIDEIWISLYGSEDIHNPITMKNTYNQVIETIHELKDCTDCILIQSPIFNDYQLWSVMQEAEHIQ